MNQINEVEEVESVDTSMSYGNKHSIASNIDKEIDVVFNPFTIKSESAPGDN
jgi:hypothetical protein